MRLLQPKLTIKQYRVFLHSLSTALTAGVPIKRALKLLGEEGAGLQNRRIARRLFAAVERGATFAQAVHWERRAFPRLFVQMVQIGECSGRLESVLINLAERADDTAETYRKLTQQISYPLALIASILVGIPAVVAFLSTLAGGGAVDSALVAALRIVVGTGTPLLVLALVVYGLWRVLPIRQWAAWLPMGSRRGMRHQFATSRFTGALAIMMEAGLPVRAALPLAAEAAGPAFALRLKEAPAKLEAGATLANALRTSALFDPLTMSSLETGEQSGKLVESLLHADRLAYVAALYRLRNYITAIEIICIVSIGFAYALPMAGMRLGLW